MGICCGFGLGAVLDLCKLDSRSMGYPPRFPLVDGVLRDWDLESLGRVMAKFLTELDVKCINDGAWMLADSLIYETDVLDPKDSPIHVPAGFQTDFASVPRVPVFFTLFGDRAHREAVLHDFLYRIDSVDCTRTQADDVFLEAMKERGKGFMVRYAMWLGVRAGGWTAYHKKKVGDSI